MVSFSSSNIEVDFIPFTLEVGDFDGDGNLDIRVGTTNGTYSSRAAILLSNPNGDANFQIMPLPGEKPGTYLSSQLTGDFNGDGIEDTFFGTEYNGISPTIILGSGAGNTTEITPEGVPNDTYTIVGGDFNGDGLTDLAAITGSYYEDSPVTILINTTEPSTNQPPDAVDDSFTTTADTSIFATVLANDSDPENGDIEIMVISRL